MNIDIMDYVDEAEIKEAILDGLRRYAKDNAERVISNCGHHLATDVVNEKLGPDAINMIADKAVSVISDLSAYTLFDTGGYGRPQSKARIELDNSVLRNKECIDKAVKSAIHNISKRDVMDVIKSGHIKMTIG